MPLTLEEMAYKTEIREQFLTRGVNLTKLEGRCFMLLLDKYPIVCTQQEMVETVWSADGSQSVSYAGRIRMMIPRINATLERVGLKRVCSIQNFKSVGYCLNISTPEGRAALKALKETSLQEAKDYETLMQILKLNGITLSELPARMLHYLLKNNGKEIAYDEIADTTWGDHYNRRAGLRNNAHLIKRALEGGTINGTRYHLQIYPEYGYAIQAMYHKGKPNI